MNLNTQPGATSGGLSLSHTHAPPRATQELTDQGSGGHGFAVAEFNDRSGYQDDEAHRVERVDGLRLVAPRITLTLNAQGNPDAVFIFQIGSTLTTAPNSGVVLVNGAQACHVFYQVGSSATLDTNTTFVGKVLALTSITANTGTTVAGRLLAETGR